MYTLIYYQYLLFLNIPHCYGDFALLKTLQNIQIVYPGTAGEHDLLFKQIYDNNYLSYFRITEHGHNYKIDSDKIIFGLSNLQPQFGWNSSWFNFSSLFYLPLLKIKGTQLSNSLLFFFVIYFFIKEIISRQKSTIFI